jgi:hypothetical protein
MIRVIILININSKLNKLNNRPLILKIIYKIDQLVLNKEIKMY